MLYPSLLPLMRTPRLPAVDWIDSPADLNGLVPFRRKTNSGFCACAIRFQTSCTNSTLASDNKYLSHHLFSKDSLHIYAQRVHQVARLKTEKLPWILESNPHTFYSFRGLKNQMRIRFGWGLDSRSRAGFWKNDRAAVRAVRTIQ